MTKATFETATLASAVSNANKIAPTKGSAFDKSNGIVLEISPDESLAVVRATDTEAFFSEWIDGELEGDPQIWRVASQVFAGVCSSLPAGKGQTVTIEEQGVAIILKCGRTRSKFQKIPAHTYPTWPTFDPETLQHVKSVGDTLNRVGWAASKTPSEVPLNGIHLNGEWAIATNRYRLARMPMEIPWLETPVTIPARTLSSLLMADGETAIGTDGSNFLMMPDDHSQVRSVTYAQEYPPTAKIQDIEYENQITFRKTLLIDCITRAQNFAAQDRLAVLRLYFGREEIAVMMTNEEIGFLGDVVEVPGYANHDRVEIHFDPSNILDALNNAPNEEVTLGYTPEKPTAVLRVCSGEYSAWIAPRKA